MMSGSAFLCAFISFVSGSCVSGCGFLDSVPMASGASGFFGLMIPMSAAKAPGGPGGV